MDAFELEDIDSTDRTLEKNVITWLTTGTNFPSGLPVTLAWDPSQTSMVDAFYQLSSGNTIVQSSYIANQGISMQNWTPLTRTNSGLVNGFEYSISGNYSNLKGSPAQPNVPMFLSANHRGQRFSRRV